MLRLPLGVVAVQGQGGAGWGGVEGVEGVRATGERRIQQRRGRNKVGGLG